MSVLELKIPPPVVGLLTAALMYGASRALPEAAIAIPLRVVWAVVLAAAGLAIDLSALLAFRRHRTTVNPLSPQRASRIVTSGVYCFTRNPMYLGMLLLLTAWAVVQGNAAAFLGLPLFVLYITAFQIQPEERVLSAQFGAPYLQYLQQVRRGR